MFSHLIRKKIMIPWNGLQGPTWPTLLFPPLAAADTWPHFYQIPNSMLRSVRVSSFMFLKHIPVVDFSTCHPLYLTLWTQETTNFPHHMAQRHLSESCFLPKRVAPAPATSVPFSWLKFYHCTFQPLDILFIREFRFTFWLLLSEWKLIDYLHAFSHGCYPHPKHTGGYQKIIFKEINQEGNPMYGTHWRV